MPDTPLTCETCGLDAPFECFEDCLRCTAAVIVANPAPWNSNRKFYVGATWLPTLEREIERQASAIAEAA